MKTFNQFLEDRHALDYIGIDDDMPDSFDHFISNLDTQEVMDLAEEWMAETKEEISEDLQRIGDILTK